MFLILFFTKDSDTLLCVSVIDFACVCECWVEGTLLKGLVLLSF